MNKVSANSLLDLVNDIEKMNLLIGQHILYLGKPYKIIDVIMSDGVMVATDALETSMQDDVYGRATRVVPEERTFLFRHRSGTPSQVWDDITFL